LPLQQVIKEGVPWLRNSIYCVAKMKPDVGGIAYNVGQLRAEIRNVDPNVAVGDVRPMTEIVAAALAARHFSLLLVGSFAVAALFLAAAGLYALISYGIHQRTREIGVRLALGATHGSILGMICKEGALLLVAGIAAGLVVAMMTAKLMVNQMYGVSERDPLSFAVVGLLLATISLLACWIAARRVLAVDPVVALRTE
jgi:putative ABC transport system permease protein